jgi:hypothetical protein
MSPLGCRVERPPRLGGWCWLHSRVHPAHLHEAAPNHMLGRTLIHWSIQDLHDTEQDIADQFLDTVTFSKSTPLSQQSNALRCWRCQVHGMDRASCRRAYWQRSRSTTLTSAYRNKEIDTITDRNNRQEPMRLRVHVVLAANCLDRGAGNVRHSTACLLRLQVCWTANADSITPVFG